ncbi:MAG: hypothetical protein ACXU8R_06870 [Xanthobacteraceae bacterium]
MQDVLDPMVAVYVFDSVRSWLLANAGLAGSVVIAALMAAGWWHQRG